MGQEKIITLGNDVVLSTGYLGNYSKRTGKTHQSLVISTLEYIPKEKGRKRRFQKNIGAFLEGGVPLIGFCKRNLLLSTSPKISLSIKGL